MKRLLLLYLFFNLTSFTTSLYAMDKQDARLQQSIQQLLSLGPKARSAYLKKYYNVTDLARADKCFVCGKEIPASQAISTHVTRVHTPGFICRVPGCDFEYWYESDKWRHRERHHSNYKLNTKKEKKTIPLHTKKAKKKDKIKKLKFFKKSTPVINDHIMTTRAKGPVLRQQKVVKIIIAKKTKKSPSVLQNTQNNTLDSFDHNTFYDQLFKPLDQSNPEPNCSSYNNSYSEDYFMPEWKKFLNPS